MVNKEKSKKIEKIEKVEGTIYYYAPEMCGVDEEDSKFDPFPLDIWALGITLYCLIYLELPFEINPNENDVLSILSIVSKGVKIEEDNKKRIVSKGLHDLLSLLLKQDPKERPTSKELMYNEWLNDGREKLYNTNTEIIKVSEEEIERSIDFFYSNAKSRNYELLWKPRAYMTGSSLLNPLMKVVSNKSINVGRESNKSINKDEVERKNEENAYFHQSKSRVSIDSFYFSNKQLSSKEKERRINEDDFFDN